MKAHDWFGLGVRATGVWCIIQGVLNLTYFFDMYLGFADMRGASYSMRDSNPVGYLLYTAVYAALAAYFICGAGHLTRLSYGGKETPDDRGTDAKPDQAA